MQYIAYLRSVGNCGGIGCSFGLKLSPLGAGVCNEDERPWVDPSELPRGEFQCLVCNVMDVETLGEVCEICDEAIKNVAKFEASVRGQITQGAWSWYL